MKIKNVELTTLLKKIRNIKLFCNYCTELFYLVNCYLTGAARVKKTLILLSFRITKNNALNPC